MRIHALTTAVVLAFGLGVSGPALAAGEAKHPPHQHWHHHDVFGHFDRPQLQRGYLVYKTVCSACHGMKLLSYRNLGEPGGLELSEAEVKALASGFQVKDINDKGEEIDRPATPADRFRYPYENEAAGRAANGGAYPPDLSVITKARHGKEDYIYALLLGYTDPPADMKDKMMPGMYYNEYFPGGQIAMPAPIVSDDLVTYADGTKATKEQMARDVTVFLAWAAEPRLEERKSVGVKVMIFMAVFTLVLFAAYRRLWKDVDH